MVSISDKFGKASVDGDYAVATTVKTARTAGESVLACFDLSKFSTDAPVFFITYKKTSNPLTGEVTVTEQTSWKGVVNPANDTFVNLTLAPGYTDLGNDVGDFVECIPTSYWVNSLVDGVSTSIDQDGTLKAGSVDNSAVLADNVVATAKMSDGAVTNAKLATTAGEPGAWATWTPTWLNFTPGSATIIARYTKIGKTIHFRLKVTLSGSTMGSTPTFSLPVTATETATRDLGLAHFSDIGVGDYSGIVVQVSNTTASFNTHTISGANVIIQQGVASTVPFTWGNNDFFECRGTYEAA